MPNIFKAMVPNAVYKVFSDIPFDELLSQGKTCMLLDYDNTLGPDRTWEPTDFSRNIVDDLKKRGFDICLVSNAKSERSSNIAGMLGIPCVTCAHKPRTDGVMRALDLMHADKNKAVMIGDQVFTDVMAGNLAGVMSILVEQYEKKEIWYVKIKRPFEKIVRKIAGF